MGQYKIGTKKNFEKKLHLGVAPTISKYAKFGLNWPFRQKIAYFDVFGPFPKIFALGCYIPLESVIFFLFFEMKKNRKSQKKIFFF